VIEPLVDPIKSVIHAIEAPIHTVLQALDSAATFHI